MSKYWKRFRESKRELLKAQQIDPVSHGEKVLIKEDSVWAKRLKEILTGDLNEHMCCRDKRTAKNVLFH